MNLRRMSGNTWAFMAVSVVGFGALLAIALYTRSSSADDSFPRSPDWPAFTMTYVESGHFNGLDQPQSSMTYTLTYDSRYSWSKVLVATDVEAAQVGTVYTFDGSDLVIREPQTRDPIIRPPESEVRVVVPDWWLVPGSDQLLVENRGYQVVDRDGNLGRLTIRRDETVECAGDDASVGVIEPAACSSDASWVNTEKIQFRTDVSPAIPVEVTSRINGETVGSITVTELVIHE